ncbi:hypothetical protein CAOG_07529 [Capsaspora owczarzaki ATCC 30864]|uniref:Uncharacterized protein n=1 Tax=Capsaspora owczarzaki (strain ATCC 30864) TaxID=595528 RepID=A0A0D2WWS9_CAPO3|nr:hypothetical protein CAOG_07529 [Capsaspora owczarzaki ATCC 30864]KJE97043.1 hypothetical protein CAOG_007529 [Capsaspora owczarzaki ATCC 30864]|eukprot:XP_004343403.1 hypothetical protein CAOG_07529 [Capsaspora owczarzaki ATCC 30864]
MRYGRSSNHRHHDDAQHGSPSSQHFGVVPASPRIMPYSPPLVQQLHTNASQALSPQQHQHQQQHRQQHQQQQRMERRRDQLQPSVLDAVALLLPPPHSPQQHQHQQHQQHQHHHQQLELQQLQHQRERRSRRGSPSQQLVVPATPSPTREPCRRPPAPSPLVAVGSYGLERNTRRTPMSRGDALDGRRHSAAAFILSSFPAYAAARARTHGGVLGSSASGRDAARLGLFEARAGSAAASLTAALDPAQAGEMAGMAGMAGIARVASAPAVSQPPTAVSSVAAQNDIQRMGAAAGLGLCCSQSEPQLVPSTPVLSRSDCQQVPVGPTVTSPFDLFAASQ